MKTTLKNKDFLFPMQAIFKTILIVTFSCLITSCYFYKVRTTHKLVEQDVEEFNKKQKYFILHSDNKAWHIQNPKIKNDTLFGVLEALKGHEKYKTTMPDKANRFKYNKNEQEVLYEVHVHATSNTAISKQLSLNIKDINKVEVYDLHFPATIGASTLAFVGTGAALTAIAAIIIILTKQSCPFIYISDGNQYTFCGEIYSGAIHKPLERHDYLLLSGIKPASGLYKIKITNEVKEHQLTNLTELIVIDHQKNINVLIDKYGEVQTFGHVQKPAKAFSLIGEDVLAKISNKDSLVFIGKPTDNSNMLTDGIILTFNPSEKSSKAKLIIRAKNSYWLDYSFGKFYDMFGIAYNAWQDRQDSTPKQELLEWGLNQNIPLKVYIMKNDTWEFADYFNVIGPMAHKDDVLSLNLDTSIQGPVKIRLEFGRGFWEIDYVALDTHENLPLNKVHVPINSAINEKGENIIGLLSANDSLYYSQPETTNYAFLTFPVPDNKSDMRTVILHSKGYYRILRNPSGIPNKKYLEEFMKPGRFNEFSNELRTSINNSR